MLMCFFEMVGCCLCEVSFYVCIVQLKLHYEDFTTITQTHTLPAPTQLNTEIFQHIRTLFRKNWKKDVRVRLLGVHASSFSSSQPDQLDLLEGPRQQRWKDALAATNHLQNKFNK